MSITASQQTQIKSQMCHPEGVWHEFLLEKCERPLIASFEEMVERYPTQIAIKMGEESLTYREFNGRVNQLAHAILCELGTGAEAVFLLMDLSIESIIAIFAVLKAGKFYSSPDLKHPPERLAQMLENGQPALLLTTTPHLALAQSLAGEKRFVFDTTQSLAHYSSANPPLQSDADSIYYITYTSGTTGQPKGIYCTHRAALHRVYRFDQRIRTSPADRIGYFRYPGFTPRDILTPFLMGSTLYLFDPYCNDTLALARWMIKEGITIIGMPVGLLRNMLQQMPETMQIPTLREISSGSEALQRNDIELFQQRFGKHCVLVNAYGTTETMGGCVMACFDANSNLEGERVPAGYADPGIEVLILDEDGTVLPPHKPGEIAIRSRYLSSGYWRQPELSAERFLPDPQNSDIVTFLTGDLGEVDASGSLIHLGRKDDQVKIRGYRVELLEVERAMMGTGHFREVAVLACPNLHGEKVLVAWVVGNPSAMLNISEVRKQLARSLPEYMIPATFVTLDVLPRTPATKVDRNALPAPQWERSTLSNSYRAANDPLEAWLVRNWEEVLGVQPIGVDDNFLELGGDSLQAMRVFSRLREKSDDYFYVSMLFNHPTIAEFAEALCAGYPLFIHKVFGITPKETAGRDQTSHALPEDEKFSQLRHRLATTYNRHTRHAPAHKNLPAIFILAPSRSGTTLLRVMLGSHPHLFAPPELYLLAHDRVRQWQESASVGHNNHSEGVVQALMQIHNSTLEDAERLLQSYIDADKTTQQLYHDLQHAIAPRLLVDKTPSYAHSLDILRMAETEFQAPLYLHLVRHPQAVIRSYEDVRFGQRNPLLHEFTLSPRTFAEWNWRIGQENILEFLQEVPQARWHRLYFEELVKAPQQTMEQICNFLGLDFHPAMLQPYRDPNQQMTQGIHALTTMAGDPKFHHHTGIDPAVADAWKDRESTIQVSPQTWAIAEKLGYAHASPSLSKPMPPNGSEWNLQRILSEIESLPDKEASQLFAAEISGGQR